MKKIFLLFGAMAVACTLHAKTVTLDVAHPLSPETITYDEKDVWTETYSEDEYTIDYPSMSFVHSAIEDWDFWYGFTIAKASDTTFTQTSDQFHCVAGGGLAGKGTPYILAYASDMMGPNSPCEVYFTDDHAWTPQEVYLCNGSWALDNIIKGGGAAGAEAAGIQPRCRRLHHLGPSADTGHRRLGDAAGQGVYQHRHE